MQIKNNMAIAYWIIVSLFMAVIVAMTYVFFLDGSPDGYPTPFISAIFGLFWIFGLGSVSYAFSKPRVLVLVDQASISVTLHYLFKTLRFDYEPNQVRHAGIIESKDSEGDPHFTAQVTMLDGKNIELKEGSREVCEHVLTQFESALQGHSGGVV
ncbi:MAG: hypothetical protein EPN17_02265 [Methylobacter sp.]|nr:MAG: hypothetical protein EPN17_02265 [Methylobacter sp.]